VVELHDLETGKQWQRRRWRYSRDGRERDRLWP